MLQRSAAFLAAILAFSAANVEATIIDSFNTTGQSCTVSPGAKINTSYAHPAPDAIGNCRDVALQWLGGKRSCLDVFTGDDGTGLSFGQSTGQAETSVTWDGTNSPGVLSFDLNANLKKNEENHFVLDIAEVTGSGVDLTMTVYSADGFASQYSLPASEVTSGILSVPYTNFTQVGAKGRADFSSVGAIVLDLNGAKHDGSDITIDSIETAGTTAPEPSTLVMAAMVAMALLGGRRWRRKYPAFLTTPGR